MNIGAELSMQHTPLHQLYEYMSELVVAHELVGDASGQPVDYRLLDVNPAFTRVTGIPRAQAIGKLGSEVYGATPPPFLTEFARVAQSGQAEQFETFYAPMGKHFQISVFSPGPGRFVTVTSDISARKEKEAEAQRLNRLYATLSTINQTVVRVQTVEELLKSVCLAAIEKAGYRLAWVGQLNTITGQLMPVAHLSTLPVSQDELLAFANECPEGQGLTGMAAREERTVISALDPQEPRFAPWKDTIARLQVKAGAALPLFDMQGLWGTLSLYSTEAEAFSDKEIALLEEVAADVSFALKRLDTEARHQQVAELLSERERELQALVANIPGAVYRCEAHAPWRVFFFSDEAATLTGRPATEFTSGRLTYADMVHPADLAGLEQIIAEAVSAFRPYEATYRIVRPEGAVRWVFEKGRARYDTQGRPLFLEGIVLDITAQRAAEQELEASQRVLSAIYERAPVMMLLLDEQLRVIRMNATARKAARWQDDQWKVVLKRQSGDVLKCVQALAHPEGCGHAEACLQCLVRKNLEEVLQGRGDGAEIECQMEVNAGGSVQRLELEGNVSRLLIEGETRLLICLNDVTARKRAEAEREELQERLLQAQKMEAIGQLAGGVAHDFNNILSAITLQLNELLEDAPPDAPLHAALKDLELGAQRAADLTRQLLIFSRRTRVEKRPLELNQCLAETLKLLQRTMGEHITLKVAAHSGSVWIKADAGMIGQVIVNLAVNARDAMPHGGQLRLETSIVSIAQEELSHHPEARPGRHALLQVTDTGCGMDAHTLSRIFEPFFTTKETGRGTGLGLATVHGIVKQHEGWIAVSSTPGTGTTFKIYLPLSESAETAPKAPASKAPVVKGSETILVVEDEPSVRRTVANCLRRAGYQVIEASDGPSALHTWALAGHSVSLLLTDLVMPGGLSGMELASRLKQQSPELRVVLMTGYSTELLETTAGQELPMTLLQKPYTITKLTETIRACLDAPPAARKTAPQGAG